MTDLCNLTATELLGLYHSGKARPSEAVESCLGRIEKIEPSLNAVLTLLADRAREQAAASDARWQAGTQRPLEGVPFLLKDIVATEGIRTTGGSAIYRDWIPSQSAALAQRLEAAGGSLLAKVQTMEFAYGHEVNTTWGPMPNPWDLERTTGGSSSGSGAGVAARYAPLAIGTDTGGSIRDPSSFCNLTGIKPTYGRVPRHGVMPLAWSLDHAGPMTRDVRDAALMLEVIAGYDAGDPMSSRQPVPEYSALLGDGGAAGLRVGVPVEWFWDIIDPEVKAAADRIVALLADAGATVTPVHLPNAHLADVIGWTVMLAEFGSLHEVTLDRLAEYDTGNIDALPAAQFVSASDYLRAQRLRNLVQRDFEAAFDDVDVLVVPGSISVAPRLDEMGVTLDGTFYGYAEHFLRTMFVFNVTGLPALSVPSGLSSTGLPMGVQLVARPFAEATAFRAAQVIQRATDFHTAVPPLVASL
ncbi:MAG: Amidase [Frankiales bacterium]|nr:Amidase [Frankiales bacterium]